MIFAKNGLLNIQEQGQRTIKKLILFYYLLQWKQRWGVVTKLSPAAGEFKNIEV